MASKAQDTLQPIAQHGQQKSPTATGQLAKLLGIAALVFLVAFGGVAAWAASYLLGGFAGKAEQLDGSLPGFGEIQGGANILVVGLDQCPTDASERLKYGDRCADTEVGPVGADDNARNDVNLLIHISDEPRKVTVISFSRDIVTELPQCVDSDGSYNEPIVERINESFSRGGLNCVAKTIEKLSDNQISIQYAAMTTWEGVVNITNAIGGVEVCIENGIADEHTGLYLEPGTHPLKGQDALQFLRTRHGVGNGGDETRMSNQQVYMSSLARKIMSDGVLSDIPTLTRLSKTVVDNVTPSEGLADPIQLVNIAQALRGVPLDEIKFVSYPLLPNPENPEVNYVPDTVAADQLWAAIISNQSFEVTGKTSGQAAPKEYDPTTGNEIDSRTGWQIDPETRLLISPETGELFYPEDVESLSDPEPTSDAGATNAPIKLPEEVTGTNAAEIVCSGGQGLGDW